MSTDRKKVLIVEDSRALNTMLAHTIRSQLQIDTQSAFSLQEANQIVGSNPEQFFLAILDLNLPDAPDGEIVDVMLDKGIRPIILTGTISGDTHAKMNEKPIIDYVVKRNLNEIQYVIDTVERLRDNINRKVMVVDDSKSSRALIQGLLERHYLQTVEAENGVEALELLKQHDDICLVVTDYNMPEMGGVELVSRIRERYSRQELAVMGISAASTQKVTIQLLKSGANDFISRPFAHEEFYCRLNQNIDAIASYRKLADSATSDFLTGLNNRKYLFETGQLLLENARRENIALTVAMLDVDHFKKTNDTYGHQVGDRVLQHIAKIFKKTLREADLVARVGGEEFCVICVNLDDANAQGLFERLRLAVCNDPLICDEATVSISISIGYTSRVSDNLDGMLGVADKALYAAKAGGRNRVESTD